jgi:hypothetical protein
MRISPEHAIAVAHRLIAFNARAYRHSFLALKRLYDRSLSLMEEIASRCARRMAAIVLSRTRKDLPMSL